MLKMTNNTKKYLILAVIFAAFIARGMPDSILGSAWPSMREELNLPDQNLGILSFITAAFIVLSSIFSPKLYSRLGDVNAVLISTVLTFASMLGFAFADSFIALCLISAPLGFAAGTIEALLNDYISTHYDPKYTNYIHCFYGVGVICSPYLMAFALAGGGFRSGYIYTAIIQLVISLFIAISIPAWKTVSFDVSRESEETSRNAGFFELLKNPSLIVMWLILIATNVIEYTCSVWGATYLFETRNMSADKAASVISIFFIGMVLGRFISGLLGDKIKTWRRIGIYLISFVVGLTVFLIPMGAASVYIGLFLIGFGNGPIYPNLLSLTPYNFERDISSSIMGTQIAAAFIGVMLAPISYGYVKALLGDSTFAVFMIVSAVVMIGLLGIFVYQIKKNGHYNSEV